MTYFLLDYWPFDMFSKLYIYQDDKLICSKNVYSELDKLSAQVVNAIYSNDIYDIKIKCPKLQENAILNSLHNFEHDTYAVTKINIEVI